VAEAGAHVFSVWLRESRVCIDKIVLAADPAYVPDNSGPAESQRVSGGTRE
jgi:hypothetical protein